VNSPVDGVMKDTSAPSRTRISNVHTSSLSLRKELLDVLLGCELPSYEYLIGGVELVHGLDALGDPSFRKAQVQLERALRRPLTL